jgi:dihydrofolate reductase
MRTRPRSSHGRDERIAKEGTFELRIRARISISVDGCLTTPGGWPAITADPAFVPGQSHGIPEFLSTCEAALMGRTTFEPALHNDFWPWPGLRVFVLASKRPAGTPGHVICNSDPAALLDSIEAVNEGADVHLVGGPATIEAFRAIGALHKLELVVLPLMLGGGVRLTPALHPDTILHYESQRELPGGSVEIVYAPGTRLGSLPTLDEGWAPASQRKPSA